jgi:DNA-binding MarR family transcriptional regulator
MNKRSTAATVMTDGELWFLLANTWFMISRLLELELSQFSITLEQSTILKTLHDKGGSTTARELEEITLRQQQSSTG